MRPLALLPFLLLAACNAASTVVGADGGAPDARLAPDAGPDSLWLHIEGNHIVTSDGTPFRGRGANLQDTRGCVACTYAPPDRAEVMRRADELVDHWRANFVRVTLESYANQQQFQVHWKGILDDPRYLEDVEAIVRHLTAKPGVYVLMSLWNDGTFTDLGWPTEGSRAEWRKLAEVFADEPKVIFGLVNEPQYNFDGAMDADVWQAMKTTVEAIRGVEDGLGTPRHIITVQGTGGWARRLDYYVTHPMPDDLVAYEVHVYDPQASFEDEWLAPARTLPIVIGEFGPAGGMTEADCSALMELATDLDVPHMAWTFHMRCPPNLIVDNSNGGCGVGMPITPTAWGQRIKDRYALPW